MGVFTKIKAAIKTRFGRIFGEDLSLEQFVFLCIGLFGILMALIGIIGNYSLGLGPLTILVPALFIVVDLGCILYYIRTKKWHVPALIALGCAIFVLFPSLWFTTGGATGSTLPLMVTSGLCIVVIFKGRLRMGLLVADVAMCVAFIVLEYFYPDIYIPYPDRASWYADMVIGMILSFVVNAWLAYLVMSRYEKARAEEAALVKQLERISLTDPLTGIYNRRYLMAAVDEAMRNAYDDGSPLTVCILDIDHFKNINDTYGHLYGDTVLAIIAKAIAACLHGKGVYGRYGGEEFLFLFPGLGVETARPIVQALCDSIRAIRWEHGGTITVSCGLGSYNKGISYSHFIESADKNLYKAKENGRDQVVG